MYHWYVCPTWHTWGRCWRKEWNLLLESSPRGGCLVRIVTSKHPYLPVTHCAWQGYGVFARMIVPNMWGLVPLGHVNFPLSPTEPQVLEVGYTTDRHIIYISPDYLESSRALPPWVIFDGDLRADHTSWLRCAAAHNRSLICRAAGYKVKLLSASRVSPLVC